MKKSTKSIILLFVGIAISYLTFSYINNDFNPAHLSKEIKMFQLLLFFTIQSFGNMIIHN